MICNSGHLGNSYKEPESMENNPIIFFDFLENIVVSKNSKTYIKCYLISTNSIPKLMKIIEKSKILDNISNNKYNISINDLNIYLIIMI